MSEKPRCDDKYDDFMNLLKKRYNMSESSEEENNKKTPKDKDSDEVSGSSWDPEADDDFEDEELPSDFSNEEFEDGKENDKNPNNRMNNTQLLLKIQNGRKYPFFRSIMLEMLIEGPLIRQRSARKFIS